MKKIDCTGVENSRQMHALLAKSLEFPGYYGHNLDALFDCLTDIRTPTTICLAGFAGLGDWKEGFASVFEDVTQENPAVKFLLD